MQLKDFLELKDDAACQSIHHVYYDDSQEDIKLLKEYLQGGQKSSTPFYKKQIDLFYYLYFFTSAISLNFRRRIFIVFYLRMSETKSKNA